MFHRAPPRVHRRSRHGRRDTFSGVPATSMSVEIGPPCDVDRVDANRIAGALADGVNWPVGVGQRRRARV